MQKDLQSKKRIKTGRTAPKSSEAGRPVLFLAENSVPLYCFSSEFLLHESYPPQSQAATQPALRLRSLRSFWAADPGNGIVAQALFSVSRRSARLFRPLGAAGSGPLDSTTLRACIKVPGEKQAYSSVSGASPKSGTSMGSPPRSADSCASRPGMVYRAAFHALTVGILP